MNGFLLVDFVEVFAHIFTEKNCEQKRNELVTVYPLYTFIIMSPPSSICPTAGNTKESKTHSYFFVNNNLFSCERSSSITYNLWCPSVCIQMQIYLSPFNCQLFKFTRATAAYSLLLLSMDTYYVLLLSRLSLSSS